MGVSVHFCITDMFIVNQFCVCGDFLVDKPFSVFCVTSGSGQKTRKILTEHCMFQNLKACLEVEAVYLSHHLLQLAVTLLPSAPKVTLHCRQHVVWEEYKPSEITLTNFLFIEIKISLCCKADNCPLKLCNWLWSLKCIKPTYPL